jgi:hypothetical protein
VTVKSILRRRPSPALVISLIALFVSLSGVSYGVATGFIDSREIKNNEVRSLDIRNNEIRTRDLRNNEVRGIDIRNSTVQGRDVALNTLTGEDVREDTLGKVPSAANADSATTAGGVSTLKIIPRTTLAKSAPPVTLATHGPLTLKAACNDSAGQTRAEVQVGTTEDNSASGGTAPPVPGPAFQTFLNAAQDAGDDKALALLNDPAAAPRSVALTDAFASAPSGKGFTGQVALYADGAAQTCTFHGHLALQG